MIKYYDFGCLNCGSKRTKSNNVRVYLVKENGTKVSVGVCLNCKTLELDKNQLGENLATSEIEFAQKNGHSEENARKQFENVVYVDMIIQ